MSKPEQLTRIEFRRHEYLAKAGDHSNRILKIEQGWAVQYAELPQARRQITAFYLPGELCEPEVVLSGKSALPIKAVTPIVASVISLDGVPSSGKMDVSELLKAVVRNSQRQTAWIVALGRRTSVERLSLLALDLFQRLEAVGMVTDNRCSIPLTQQDLGDATGMTPVHINRVLRGLQVDGVMTLTGKTLTVLDMDALRRAAGPQ